MKHRLLTLNLRSLMHHRNLLLLICGALALSNGMLCMALWQKQETIVLVPPEIRRGFSLSSQPSVAYLEEMSLFFASLVLDNSQGSFPYKREMILKYVSPEMFESVKHQLLQTQGRYVKEGLSTHFRPLEVQVDLPKLQALVKGELVSFVGGRKMTEVRETFVIRYSYKSWFLSILSFKTPLEAESLEPGSLEITSLQMGENT